MAGTFCLPKKFLEGPFPSGYLCCQNFFSTPKRPTTRQKQQVSHSEYFLTMSSHEEKQVEHQRALEKFSGNPLITVGLLGTLAMMAGGVRSMSRGENLSNYMFGRAVAQTITAGILFYTFADKEKMMERATYAKEQIFGNKHE